MSANVVNIIDGLVYEGYKSLCELYPEFSYEDTWSIVCRFKLENNKPHIGLRNDMRERSTPNVEGIFYILSIMMHSMFKENHREHLYKFYEDDSCSKVVLIEQLGNKDKKMTRFHIEFLTVEK